MLKDRFRKARDGISALFKSRTEDQYRGIKGEVFWKLEDTTTGEIQEGHFKNTVTLDASILIARLMKSPSLPNVSEPAFGVLALAVGTGNVGWNPLDPPSPTTSQRSLENEIARKQIASSDFIDSGGGISGIPTNVVDFTTIFSESEAVGALDEMGLLGGDVDTNMGITDPITPPSGPYDATVDVTGKDTLVNYLTFPVISKPATSTLTWTWRLTFSIFLWIGIGNIVPLNNGPSTAISTFSQVVDTLV
jgi:hypothetical protein